MQRAILIFFVGAGLFLVFWLIWARTGINFANQQVASQGGDSELAGRWGDSFGAFNALFASLGFAAVLATLLLQGQALREQRNDLHRERFESSFFQLLALMRELRDNVENLAPGPDVTIERVRGVQAIAELVSSDLNRWLRGNTSQAEKLSAEHLRRWYDEYVLPRHQNGVGPYFRVIYNILDRVRSDPVLTGEEKNSYGRLLRGQLNNDETLLLAVNGLHPISKDFGSLIVRFRLLKYLPESRFREALMAEYAGEAFQGRD